MRRDKCGKALITAEDIKSSVPVYARGKRYELCYLCWREFDARFTHRIEAEKIWQGLLADDVKGWIKG